MTQYAMYGGSFDPIHIGHVSMVERAIAMGYEVLVVPAYRHAFGKRSAPFEQRVRMCELALETCGLRERARVCTIEQSLARNHEAPIYTYDVLCALRQCLGSPPCLLVGPDIASEWTRWHRHADIDNVFGRLPLPMTESVRSSMIREHLLSGNGFDEIRCSVPLSVQEYIKETGLYGCG